MQHRSRTSRWTFVNSGRIPDHQRNHIAHRHTSVHARNWLSSACHSGKSARAAAGLFRTQSRRRRRKAMGLFSGRRAIDDVSAASRSLPEYQRSTSSVRVRAFNRCEFCEKDIATVEPASAGSTFRRNASMVCWTQLKQAGSLQSAGSLSSFWRSSGRVGRSEKGGRLRRAMPRVYRAAV